MDTKALVSAPGRRRSRRHSPEFKAQVIAACLQPGVSIAAVAQANGLNANFLRTWVKAYRDEQRTGLTAKRADESPVSSVATLVPVTGKRSTLPPCQPSYTAATVLSGNSSSIRL